MGRCKCQVGCDRSLKIKEITVDSRLKLYVPNHDRTESHAVPLYFYAFLINSVYVCIACFLDLTVSCAWALSSSKPLYTAGYSYVIPHFYEPLLSWSYYEKLIVSLAPDGKNGNISHRILSISRPSMLTLPGKEMTWCQRPGWGFSYFNQPSPPPGHARRY